MTSSRTPRAPHRPALSRWRDTESSASYVSSSLTPKQRWHSLRSVWPVAAKVHRDRTAEGGDTAHSTSLRPKGRTPCDADSSEREPYPIRASPMGRASHQDRTGRPPNVQAHSSREGGACSAARRLSGRSASSTAPGPVSGGQHPHLAGRASDSPACTGSHGAVATRSSCSTKGLEMRQVALRHR